jgi:hypothetical protein
VCGAAAAVAADDMCSNAEHPRIWDCLPVDDFSEKTSAFLNTINI